MRLIHKFSTSLRSVCKLIVLVLRFVGSMISNGHEKVHGIREEGGRKEFSNDSGNIGKDDEDHHHH